MERLLELLDRSDKFADHLRALVDGNGSLDLTPRVAACAAAADLSIEHAHAVRTLILVATGNSACVVF